ncbi:MAG: coproporphyrinogen III oxidase family protein [Lentisphaeria bacterium]|nr:coproporphyrinogen III oxidase family protein [Lentisphaeria bacterium]
MNCYIHVPFCASKCGYCAFYSEAVPAGTLIEAYLDHLEKTVIPERVSTLYIGGGTPTYLNVRQLERFIGILREKFTFEADAELSIEANPESLTEEKVGLLRGFFNRISLGIQSFDGQLRRRIGRKCSDEALEKAIRLIREADFLHWNCDLIYSLPDESRSDWERDLHSAAETGADHISCYSLTPERSAILGQTFEVDDEREVKMYHAAEKILSQYGIKRYEISNYARDNARCRHNMNVWRGGILRGYGPGAADFDGVDRHTEIESVTGWLKGEACSCDHIPAEARLNEIFAVNLRTIDGWTPDLWQMVPGADDWEKRQIIAAKAASTYPGCLQISASGIKLSADGLLFWNEIAAELL